MCGSAPRLRALGSRAPFTPPPAPHTHPPTHPPAAQVKGAMKRAPPSARVLLRCLNARQFGLKLMANVTYGYTAAGFSGGWVGVRAEVGGWAAGLRPLVRRGARGPSPQRRIPALSAPRHPPPPHPRRAFLPGRMPMAELADAIVQSGRETLERAIRQVEAHPRWRARVVYGDTGACVCARVFCRWGGVGWVG